MIKIIFLDFDGVLLTDHYAIEQIDKGLNIKNYLDNVIFDTHCVNNLNNLLTTTNANIVLSTSWALGNNISKISQCLLRNGIDPTLIFEYDDPDTFHYMTPRKLSSLRSQEISWWLDDHPEVDQWVAIDDDPSISNLQSNYVMTDPNIGLNLHVTKKAYKFLK